MFFTFAWLGKDQDHLAFEEQVPLLFSGEHLKLWRLRQTFTILFLDGYHRLSNHYLSQLKPEANLRHSEGAAPGQRYDQLELRRYFQSQAFLEERGLSVIPP
jgi:hypothetical protein